jgi:CheY-like chemotaxis protein
MTKVLIIEDGLEYSETLTRFLGDRFGFERVGSGPAALARLEGAHGIDGVFLDMRFDRTPDDELLGDLDELLDRFNGDPAQARRFREDHQGTYVLAALREAGVSLPVLMSYDFDGEPRRWKRLAARFGPLDYLPDNASPAEVAERLQALTSG